MREIHCQTRAELMVSIVEKLLAFRTAMRLPCFENPAWQESSGASKVTARSSKSYLQVLRLHVNVESVVSMSSMNRYDSNRDKGQGQARDRAGEKREPNGRGVRGRVVLLCHHRCSG